MTDDAVMTVEVTLLDRDAVVAFGGPPTQSAPMALALADRLGIEPAPGDALLTTAMTASELVPITEWIKENYPQIRFRLVPYPLGLAKCEWRSFRLVIDSEIDPDERLVTTVSKLIDKMHKQIVDWDIPRDKSIGCIIQNCERMLQATVFPLLRVVYVGALADDTVLPETVSSPYHKQPHH